MSTSRQTAETVVIPKAIQLLRQDCEQSIKDGEKLHQIQECEFSKLIGLNLPSKTDNSDGTPAMKKAKQELELAIEKYKNEMCQTLEAMIPAGTFPSNWQFVGHKEHTEQIQKTLDPHTINQNICLNEWNKVVISTFHQRIKYIDTEYDIVAEIQKKQKPDFNGCIETGQVIKIHAAADDLLGSQPKCTFRDTGK